MDVPDGPLQIELKVPSAAITQKVYMWLFVLSMESTTGLSCSRETTSPASVWSFAKTVPS